MKLKDGGISIIIPVFNGALFIEDAYANILNQKINNFEIIFIDNNSTDKSVEKIIKFQQKDKRVSFYMETTQGAAAARNKGIEKAKGEFLYFFDVDDELYENAILKLLAILNSNTEIDTVFGKSTKGKEVMKPKGLDNIYIIIKKRPFWGLHWFNQFSTLVGPPSFLHRASTIQKIGNFPKELRIGEDAAFHIKIGLFCTVYFIDEFIYNYRRHPESTTSNNNDKVDRLNTYWKQYINFYIPYSTSKYNEMPKEFNRILNKNLGFSIGKLLLSEKKFKNRLFKYKECMKQLSNYKLPVFIQISIRIVLLFGSRFAFKLFVKLYMIIYNRTFEFVSRSGILSNEKEMEFQIEVVNKTKF